MFACSSWEYRQGVDLNGDERQVIVFHLVHPSEEDQVAPSSPTSPDKPLDQLRQLTLEAASRAEQSEPQEAKSLYYKRSTAVRRYVVERAGGVCESCRNQLRLCESTVPLTWNRTTPGGSLMVGLIIPGGSELSARTAIGRFTMAMTDRKRTNIFNSIWPCWRNNLVVDALRWVLPTLVVLALGYLGIGLFVTNRLTSTVREPTEQTPADEGLKFQEVGFRSTDGLALKGWWVPGEGSSRAVMLVHGLEGSKADQHVLKTASVYFQGGYSVLMFDLRSHGESESGLWSWITTSPRRRP
jgi:hypothetical protein